MSANKLTILRPLHRMCKQNHTVHMVAWDVFQHCNGINTTTLYSITHNEDLTLAFHSARKQFSLKTGHVLSVTKVTTIFSCTANTPH